jgi:rubrerythrin
MDQTPPPLASLKNALEEIRDRAEHALRQLEQPSEVRVARWRCCACGHTKHFTRPVPVQTARPCPKCQGHDFLPAGAD